ncbi:MAG TPA: hypothetical protein VGL65_05050 [Gemmatimonadales bacterium]|jgi:hypothetical protein
MLTARRRIRLCCLALVSLLVAAVPITAQGIPARLTDSEFWTMMADFSEPDGYFRSENFLSNETGFQGVIPELQQTVRPGGVYFGVGPEQNFTYLVAVHPAMAFIIDIRHQNAVQHLLYKALMELYDNRVDFLCRLFSRPRPAGLAPGATVDAIFAAVDAAPRDSMLYYQTLAAVKDHLEKDHHFTLSPVEIQLLEHNFDVFYEAGPELSYNFNAGAGGGFGGRGRGMPNYTDLMVATDNAQTQRSYLATEANYQLVRDMELRNLIVPLTGNFAGPKAIRAAGDYVRAHGAVVTVFYTSNVEQYLFQDGIWADFARNVATLPLDSTSTFIRSGGGARGYGGGMRSSLLQSITALLATFNGGKISTWQDVLESSH